MPLTPTFPGVYLQQAAIGDTAIRGTATSITAFLGRAPRGPVDQPLTCFSFADYERLYGGLAEDFPLAYAVSHFFQNGGATAIIARLFEPQSAQIAGYAHLTFPPSSGCPTLAKLGWDPTKPTPLLCLQAKSPGTWANHLQATVTTAGITDATSARFAAQGLTTADLFNLTLTLLDQDGTPTITETYLNLTTQAGNSPNRIDRVLAAQSALAHVCSMPQTPPATSTTATLTIPGDDGRHLTPATYLGQPGSGIQLLDAVPAFQLLCIPPDHRLDEHTPLAEQELPAAIRQQAAAYCTARRAIFLADPPAAWESALQQGHIAAIDPSDLGISGTDSAGILIARNAAVYFPNLQAPDPLRAGKASRFAPCGAVAGVIARTDAERGVWKSPAGTDATLAGLSPTNPLAAELTDTTNAALNVLGINCLRAFPEGTPSVGPVLWGARTLAGADQLEDDYKYLAVRRLILYLESSIQQGIQWATFEPNDEALWSSLRLSVSSFLADLSRQGAFYNYNVACDAATTTAADIANGIVNILVQIAPLEPAEFVALYFRQTTQAPA